LSDETSCAHRTIPIARRQKYPLLRAMHRAASVLHKRRK
jgi:hypothetical protein